ncbi:MAG: hypothetical protein R3C18_17550 [Planctomycetaceae bacterium]
MTTDNNDDPTTGEVVLGAYALLARSCGWCYIVPDVMHPIEDALARALTERLADVQNGYYSTGTSSSS